MAKFVLRPGVDIVAMLKERGYSTYVIAKAKERTGEYILGQSTLTKLRKGGLPSWAELAKLVSLLRVSPVDLIAFQTDKGAIYDLTGNRIETPAAPADPSSPSPSPEPKTYIQHGHPGDDGYDPDDPGDQMPCDDDY